MKLKIVLNLILKYINDSLEYNKSINNINNTHHKH